MTAIEKPMTPTHSLLDERSGGDGFEKPLWPLLKEHFSNYEIFWSEFVWPLTNRFYPDRANRKNLHFRPELAERCDDLVWLAQAHYTAFRKVGSIYLRVHKWKFDQVKNDDADAALKLLLNQDRFLDIYTQLLSVDDMVSTIAATVERLRVRAGFQAAPQESSPQDIRAKCEEWLKSNDCAKALENHRLTGFPVSIPIIHRGQSLQAVLSKELWKEYSAFRERTARYRNLLHNPQPAQVWIKDEHLVPKSDKLKKYRLWSRITTATEQEIREDFEAVEPALATDLNALLSLLNRIWTTFIEQMRAVANTTEYGRWLAEVPKEADPYVNHVGLSYSTWAMTSTSAALPMSLSAVRAIDPDELGKFGR